MSKADAAVPDRGVREEYYNDTATDVEVEDQESESTPAKPWNPEEIRVATKQFSLRNILDMINQKDLELAPDFQRRLVWKEWQKSRLIESVMLQIPLPAFYFAEDSDGMMRVVDGLQRLSTINDYVRNGRFVLGGLEYLNDCSGSRFEELSPGLQRRINNTQIVVHVIDPTTPSGVKYDIFKRINTGGTPLNAQEIRHCMSNSRSRDFLVRCTSAPEFDRATGGRFRDHFRMGDREVVLRYCAFWMSGVEGYLSDGSMDAFLERANGLLDDSGRVSDRQLDDMYSSFLHAMSNAYALFGEHAFRKWSWGQKGRNPINRPLFESWSYVLARYESGDLLARKSAIVKAARDLMSNNTYLDAVTTSTGDPRKVRLRFMMAEQAAGAGR